MIDILFYGDGYDSQRVINSASGVVDADVGYRYEPASLRDDDRSAWGVRVYAESVEESAVRDALESEFGSLDPVQSAGALSTVGIPPFSSPVLLRGQHSPVNPHSSDREVGFLTRYLRFRGRRVPLDQARG